MKLFCVFLLIFAIQLATHAADDSKLIGDYGIKKCNLQAKLPASISNYCPGLDLKLSTHAKKVMKDSLEKYSAVCPTSVNQICSRFGNIMLKYSYGGQERCETDLKETLCGYWDPREYKIHSQCLFIASVLRIANQPERFLKGRESEVCEFITDTADSTFCRGVIDTRCSLRVPRGFASASCKSILGSDVCSR